MTSPIPLDSHLPHCDPITPDRIGLTRLFLIPTRPDTHVFSLALTRHDKLLYYSRLFYNHVLSSRYHKAHHLFSFSNYQRPYVKLFFSHHVIYGGASEARCPSFRLQQQQTVPVWTAGCQPSVSVQPRQIWIIESSLLSSLSSLSLASRMKMHMNTLNVEPQMLKCLLSVLK